MLYIVFFDPYGADDLAETIDHRPTEDEERLFAQAHGYQYAGCVEAESPQDALRIAAIDFEGGGCIA